MRNHATRTMANTVTVLGRTNTKSPNRSLPFLFSPGTRIMSWYTAKFRVRRQRADVFRAYPAHARRFKELEAAPFHQIATPHDVSERFDM